MTPTIVRNGQIVSSEQYRAEAHGAPQTGRFIITPAVAEAWLNVFNTGTNRPLGNKHVDYLAGVLKRGEWIYNGEPIAFSATRILNGQHRLYACSESGIAFESMVITGLHDDAFDTFDGHKKRSIGDLFGVEHEKNLNQLVATLTLLWRLEENRLATSINLKPSKPQLDAVLSRHPDVRDSAAFVHSAKAPFRNSIAALIHYVAHREDPVKAAEFFHQLMTGYCPALDLPAKILGDRMRADLVAKTKLGPMDKLALYIKAWTAFRDGQKIKALRWSNTNGEKFPKLVCPPSVNA